MSFTAAVILLLLPAGINVAKVQRVDNSTVLYSATVRTYRLNEELRNISIFGTSEGEN
jgi:hypothetical protein